MFFQLNAHPRFSPLFVPRYLRFDWRFPRSRAFPNNYGKVQLKSMDENDLFSEHALIWRIYVDEASQFDYDITDRFRSDMDSLLVFSGLFSAIVSTILVRFHDDTFEPDYASAMIAILAHSMNDRRTLAGAELIPLHQTWSLGLANENFKPRVPFSVAMMWWLSLLFCLGMALLAVVVKQWLNYYTTTVSTRPLTSAITRHHRILGWIGWQIPLIVGILPYVLSLGMLFFAIGVLLLTVTFSLALTVVFSIVACAVLVTYLLSLTLPLARPDCPTISPLTMLAHWALYVFRTKKKNLEEYKKLTTSFIFRQHFLYYEVKFRHAELGAVKDREQKLTAQALTWLYDTTRDHVTRLVILKSIKPTDHWLHEELRKIRSSIWKDALNAFRTSAPNSDTRSDDTLRTLGGMFAQLASGAGSSRTVEP